MAVRPASRDATAPRLRLSPLARLRLLWIAASGLGACLGAVLAVVLFPEMAFARNPTGHHDPRQIGFALALGAPLGLAQALALAWLFRRTRWTRFVGLVLWTPVTATGVVLMLLPLWDIDAEALIFIAPFGGLAAYLWRGLVVLALGQWLLVRTMARLPSAWALLTAAGAFAGASWGLLAGLLGTYPLSLAAAALGLPQPPMEPAWALAFGAALGVAQCQGVAEAARRDLDRLAVAEAF